jgi:hypothetical protein
LTPEHPHWGFSTIWARSVGSDQEATTLTRDPVSRQPLSERPGKQSEVPPAGPPRGASRFGSTPNLVAFSRTQLIAACTSPISTVVKSVPLIRYFIENATEPTWASLSPRLGRSAWCPEPSLPPGTMTMPGRPIPDVVGMYASSSWGTPSTEYLMFCWILTAGGSGGEAERAGAAAGPDKECKRTDRADNSRGHRMTCAALRISVPAGRGTHQNRADFLHQILTAGDA